MKITKQIQSFLYSVGIMHIDFNWALQKLNEHIHEVNMAKEDTSGTILSEVIGRRRESRTSILNMETMGITDKEFSGDGVGVLNLSGVMRLSDGFSSRGIQSMCNDIQQMDSNPNIQGAIVKCNSGGGESLAGNALKQACKNFSKPIVFVSDFMGSAALNGSLGADMVVMNGEGSSAGSIGSFISLPRGLREAYNEKIQDIYSDTSPDKNKDFRAFLEGNEGPLRAHVTESANIFRNSVDDNRDLNAATRDSTLAGGMFFAEDAVARGIADKVGGINDAFEFIRAASGTGKTNQDLPTVPDSPKLEDQQREIQEMEISGF